MGLLNLFKNAISNSLGLTTAPKEAETYKLFYVTDEQGKLITTFRLFSNCLNLANVFISNSSRCKVDSIETVVAHTTYTVHAIDRDGNERKFKMDSLT